MVVIIAKQKMMVVSIKSVACASAGKWLESGYNFKIELTGLSMEIENDFKVSDLNTWLNAGTMS